MAIREALAQAITSLPSVQGAPTPKDPASFVTYLVLLAFTVTGLAVLIAFLIGAFRYFFSAGSPSVTSDAKDRMIHALIGFFVMVFSILLLYIINPDLVRLKNPGFPTLVLPSGTGKQPGRCGFTSAQWAGSGAPGANVGLVVIAADCKDGDIVTFRVLSSAGGEIAKFQGTLSGDRAEAAWTVPLNALGSQYYFEAVIGAEKVVSTTLDVSGSGGGIAGDCMSLPRGNLQPAICSAPCTNTVNTSVTNPATGQPYAYACDDIIRSAALTYRVSAALVVAIMQAECDTGDPNCTSAKGSCGLMQVNPSFVTTGAYPECKPLLGSGANTPAAACDIMKANPDIAIAVGTCILANVQTNAANKKSQFGYEAAELLYTAAAYNGGPDANLPSCNCRDASNPQLPLGCASTNSTACKNCATAIPRWICPFNEPATPGGACTANTGFAPTRDYAPSVQNYYAHFSDCTQWQ